MHFARNDLSVALGQTRLKHRQLRALGFDVLSVPIADWEYLETSEEKVEYLREGFGRRRRRQRGVRRGKDRLVLAGYTKVFVNENQRRLFRRPAFSKQRHLRGTSLMARARSTVESEMMDENEPSGGLSIVARRAQIACAGRRRVESLRARARARRSRPTRRVEPAVAPAVWRRRTRPALEVGRGIAGARLARARMICCLRGDDGVDGGGKAGSPRAKAGKKSTSKADNAPGGAFGSPVPMSPTSDDEEFHDAEDTLPAIDPGSPKGASHRRTFSAALRDANAIALEEGHAGRVRGPRGA